ncbi:MAG: hypothetical protein ACREIP_16580, partial [Alphaproteobacteria bacterium]
SDRFLQQLREPSAAKAPAAPPGGSVRPSRGPLKFRTPGALPARRETDRRTETLGPGRGLPS